MSHIAVLSKMTYVDRVHPCRARLYCTGLAETVTTALHVGALVVEYYIVGYLAKRGGGKKKEPRAPSVVNFSYCTIFTTPYLPTLS